MKCLIIKHNGNIQYVMFVFFATSDLHNTILIQVRVLTYFIGKYVGR